MRPLVADKGLAAADGELYTGRCFGFRIYLSVIHLFGFWINSEVDCNPFYPHKWHLTVRNAANVS